MTLEQMLQTIEEHLRQQDQELARLRETQDRLLDLLMLEKELDQMIDLPNT